MCAKGREAWREDAPNGRGAQNEEASGGTSWRRLFFYVRDGLILKGLACDPNYMCFALARNDPEQLQGRSDKEPGVASSGGARSDPVQPQSVHYGITMITFWAGRFRRARVHSLLRSVHVAVAFSNWKWCVHMLNVV